MKSNADEMKESRLAWQLHVEATNEQFETDEITLGPWTSYSLRHDPKHMAFVLSRYKFCAKMLSGKGRVLEVGCGDAFGAPIVAQEVDHLHCLDWEERNISGNRRRLSCIKNITFETADVSSSSVKGKYDAIFNIDVIEHLEPDFEKSFMNNMVGCLSENGVMIVGTPNESASQYATHRSDHQHINLKNEKTLRQLFSNYFHNTFMFSMNDEVVHTGYSPMAHYLFAIGVVRK
jgi:2-polyprenyl-3-methyl-5-hydroxy-6-metoxy-1,4-benzoquinol methylase